MDEVPESSDHLGFFAWKGPIENMAEELYVLPLHIDPLTS